MRRLSTKSRIVSTAGAMALCAGVALTSAASASAKPQSGPPTGTCVSFGGVTEVLKWQEVYQPQNPDTPVVGDGAKWHIDLVDQVDKKVGTIDGFIVGIYKRPDGHVLGYEDAKARILGTTWHILGPIDLTAGFKGANEIKITVTGIKGKYKGWVGDWRYRVEKATKAPYYWQAKLEADFCKLDSKRV